MTRPSDVKKGARAVAIAAALASFFYSSRLIQIITNPHTDNNESRFAIPHTDYNESRLHKLLRVLLRVLMYVTIVCLLIHL